MPDTETVALGTILAVCLGLVVLGVVFGSVPSVVAGLAATVVVLVARDDDAKADVCPGCGREIPDGRRQCGECTVVAGHRK